jgi:putative oxidoreductase
MRFVLSLAGRIALSLIFILSSIQKILHWDATQEGVAQVLQRWIGDTVEFPVVQHILELMIPYTISLCVIAVVCEAVGGLMVMLGIMTRLGALLLLLFMVPATLLFHAFWMYPAYEQELQLVMFLKNLAILGGIILTLAHEGREKSLKAL